ncbi:MAG: DUF5683 domain-containing protein [Ferruginibacter sp.]
MKKIFHSLIILLFTCLSVSAQEKLIVDTSGKVVFSKKTSPVKDSTTKKYNPGIAIRRSAMLPGWGQFTNKKYWKIPLVYAGVGIPAYLFTRNLKQYQEAKQAFILASDSDPSNDNQIKEPYYSVRAQPDRIRVFRNSVRQNVDYSVLFFIIFWGLNVADAAVDANLKTFDVGDDLTLQLKPGYSPLANTNGLSLVLNIGKRK